MTTPGWYQDPRFPGLMRWWDGQAWTEHTQPAAGMLPPPPPQVFHQPPAYVGASAASVRPVYGRPDPVKDLADATRAARVAVQAIAIGAVAYVVDFIGISVTVRSLVRQVRDWYDGPRLADGRPPTLTLHGATSYSAITNLFVVVMLVVGVLFLVWFHKAATVAARLGLPARRSPGWAVGGFFVPIASFWFPYRSARDLFPPGHPGGALVVRWWSLYLAMIVLDLGIYGAAWFSQAAAVTVAIIASLAAVGSAYCLRAMVREVTRCHTELSTRNS
jgi:hypothetical protein